MDVVEIIILVGIIILPVTALCVFVSQKHFEDKEIRTQLEDIKRELKFIRSRTK